MRKAIKLPIMQLVSTRLMPDRLAKMLAICEKKRIRLAEALREGAELWLDRELDRE